MSNPLATINFFSPTFDNSAAGSVSDLAEAINPEAVALYNELLIRPDIVKEFLTAARRAKSVAGDPMRDILKVDSWLSDEVEPVLDRSKFVAKAQSGGAAYTGKEIVKALEITSNDKIVMVIVMVFLRYMTSTFVYSAVHSGFAGSLGVASLLYTGVYAMLLTITILLASTTNIQMLQEVLYIYNYRINAMWIAHCVPVILQLILSVLPFMSPKKDVATTFDEKEEIMMSLDKLSGITTFASAVMLARYM